MLAVPSTKLVAGYFAMMDAAAGEDAGYRVPDTAPLRRDPAGYVRRQLQVERGENLPTGFVPQSTRWLVLDQEVVGEVRVRHWLSPMLELEGGHVGYFVHPRHRRRSHGHTLLRGGLAELRRRRVSAVLVTCDEANTASRRIIEAAGGVFEGHSRSPRRGVPVRRYWILQAV